MTDLDNLLAQVGEIVEKVCKNSHIYSETSWEHCLAVGKIAEDLARRTGADPKICCLAGLLHDFGAVKYGRDNHHLTGAKESVRILKELNCPPQIIGRIVHCIFSHRASQLISPKTIEAECVSAADAIHHFERIDELVTVAQNVFGLHGPEVKQWIMEKIERDWQKIKPQFRSLTMVRYLEAKKKINNLVTNNEP